MADEQPSKQERNINDRAEAEPIGPIPPETGSETDDETDDESSPENSAESASHAEVQQGSGTTGESANRPGASDIEALAQRLAKTEAELETVKKQQTSRARVRIETKTVPPLRKNEQPEPSPVPTRQEQRRRYLFGRK